MISVDVLTFVAPVSRESFLAVTGVAIDQVLTAGGVHTRVGAAVVDVLLTPVSSEAQQALTTARNHQICEGIERERGIIAIVKYCL